MKANEESKNGGCLFVLFIIILSLIFFAACEKPEEIVPEQIVPESQIAICNFKTGRYNGEQHLIIPDKVDLVQFAYREIYRIGDSLVIRWWSAPDTTTTTLFSDTLSYDMVFDNTNTSCGLQRVVYVYKTVSVCVGDSLFESGTVNYKWYYENKLVQERNGTFSARLKFVDSKTPHKPYKP